MKLLSQLMSTGTATGPGTGAATIAQAQHTTFQLKEATYTAFGQLANRCPVVFAASSAVRCGEGGEGGG